MSCGKGRAAPRAKSLACLRLDQTLAPSDERLDVP